MLVLILAAGSFLIFMAVLACLLVAHTLEQRELIRRHNVWLSRPASLLSITQAFEPLYAPLWEAPVCALELIEGTRSGIAATRLQPIFQRAASRFPEIYDGSEFVPWLEFLASEDLIFWETDSNKVRITDKGREFLANRFVSDALLEA